jgi:hypothetical protein
MSTFLYPFILPVFQPLVPTCCSILLFYPALPPSSPTNPNSPFPSSFIVSFPILLSAHVDLFFLLACFFFALLPLCCSLLVSVFNLFVSFPSYHPSIFYTLSITTCFPFFFLFFFFPFLFTTPPSPPCVCLLVHFSLLQSSLSCINAACSLFFFFFCCVTLSLRCDHDCDHDCLPSAICHTVTLTL